MPTKRTPKKRGARGRITAEVITLWRRLREIQDAGDDEFWEEDGGRRREFSDGEAELKTMLARRDPWLYTPLEATDAEPPEWMDEPWRVADYATAWALRCELDRLAK